VAIGYTIAMTGILLGLGVGNLAALLLVLFIPGYVLVAALFPAKKEIDWIERIALSIGLSIAVVPLLGLALNFTPLGIRFAPIVAFIAAFSGGVGVIAYWRRLGIPPEDRLGLTLLLSLPAWKGESLLDKALTVALVASILTAAGVLAYVITTPRPGERFTALWITDANGTLASLPTRLNVTEVGRVILGVDNHEFARTNYTLRADLVGIQVANVSGNLTTVEVNRTEWDRYTFDLDHEATWTRNYSFSISSVAVWKVQFLLFLGSTVNVTNPYRSVHLFVNVTAPGSAPSILASPFPSHSPGEGPVPFTLHACVAVEPTQGRR
jgi:uncharacterized membrane protein